MDQQSSSNETQAKTLPDLIRAGIERNPSIIGDIVPPSYYPPGEDIAALTNDATTLNSSKTGPPRGNRFPAERGPLKNGRSAGGQNPKRPSQPTIAVATLPKTRIMHLANVIINTSLVFLFFQAVVYSCLSTGYCYASRDANGNIGPSGITLFELGGCNTNSIRSGESLRLYWSMFMHSGWVHLALNVLSQIQYIMILEPVIGTFRVFMVFFASGLGGSLFSATLDPCKTTVGSSGGLFGLTSAILMTCLESWRSVDNPLILFILILIISLISILTSLNSATATWAHLGGFLVGILVMLLTTEKFEILGINGLRHKWENLTRYKSVNRSLTIIPTDWRLPLLCFRGIGLVGLVTTFPVLYSLIYGNYEFQPPGSLTWSGAVPCCCCYLNPVDGKIIENWYCFECSIKPFNNDTTWGEHCDESLLQPGVRAGSQFLMNP